MDRLTDRKTAEALRSNVAGLLSKGMQVDIADLRYIKLAEYEDSTECDYEKGYSDGRKSAQDEINRLREYIARQTEEEYE